MVTEEEITELMKTPEGRRLIEQMLGEETAVDTATDYGYGVQDQTDAEEGLAVADVGATMGQDATLGFQDEIMGQEGPMGQDEIMGQEGQIGASPVNPGATRGMPPAQIGASPDIPGATRGFPPGESGINANEANQRSMMVQELLRRRGQRY
jgi:hypothetical protein